MGRVLERVSIAVVHRIIDDAGSRVKMKGWWPAAFFNEAWPVIAQKREQFKN
jgi:hypothetical protein